MEKEKMKHEIDFEKCDLFIGMSLEEAVEKQILKKPINVKWYCGNISNADCPSCGYSFPDIGGMWEIYNEIEKYPFCPNCGQKIDW